MSAIKLIPSSGGGSVSLVPPSSTSGADVNITLPTSDQGFGRILQVVQAIKQDTFTTTSSTMVDVGLAVSITPASTSNKVLVAVNLGLVGGLNNSYPGFQLVRVSGSTSTPLGLGNTATGSRVNVTFGNLGFNGPSGDVTKGLQASSSSYQFLDSPSVVDTSITYKLQVFSGYNSHSVYVNRQFTNDDQPYIQRSSSTITAMEVAA
tara:strand:- start:1068 stop:1685 length:618 start_codon:yes stop_codon:yes gene_type:complete